MPEATVLSDFWNDQLVEHGRQYVFLVLLGLAGSFGFIRTSARLMRSPRVPWWPGSVVSDSGLHLHHLVWGIFLMMGAGTVGFAGFDSDFLRGLCAALFGVGMGLTIDEFALWVHLDDVYWAEEGRASIDAAVLSIAAVLLVVLGVRPFELDDEGVEGLVGSVLGLALYLTALYVAISKGRIFHGVLGIVFHPLAIYAALRLGKPESAWARRQYGDRRPDKQERAERRFPPDRRSERFKRRLRDLVGGTTDAEFRKRLEGDDSGAS
ncbi:MAG TPA: hypothetical protein VKA36_10100 [Solirubrobacterales bacterium]|nr:hypothetical protein [Solirubrobacterales bacterium]